jgi:uncharacterized lipoprotein YmbA
MRVHLLACILGFLIAAGCGFLRPHTDETQYFVLTSEELPPARAPTQVLLGVDRIELPEYLVRPEIVTRTQSNELKLAENDRWGEPLKDGFARTLRSNLENRLGSRVLTAPFDPAHRPALILDVEVRRFERVLPDGAALEATWTLRDGSNGAVLVTKQALLRQAAATGGTRATVAALSQVLAALAAQIADTVRARS